MLANPLCTGVDHLLNLRQVSWQISQRVGHGPLQPEPRENDQLRIKCGSCHRAVCGKTAVHAVPEGATVSIECSYLQRRPAT